MAFYRRAALLAQYPDNAMKVAGFRGTGEWREKDTQLKYATKDTKIWAAACCPPAMECTQW